MKKRLNRRQFLGISASATVMAAFGSTPVFAATTPSTAITLDGNAAGRIFDGIGGISGGGGTSRLLIDYPAHQQSQILDYLFRPNYGASLHILKCEIGSDTDTTNGAEASHMRTRTDQNYERGYEWWLMEQAKARNSSIKLYGLEWGAPGWFTPDIDPSNAFWSNDNINYLINWISHAQSDHGLFIDYLGGHNESGYNITWYETLRTALNNAGFTKTKIVGADSTWSIAGDLSTNPAFSAVIDIVGTHYPCGYLGNYSTCNSTPTAESLNKPLWASENGSEDYNAGAEALARALNRGYIDGKMTSLINWSLIAAWYSTLPFAGDGLMLADEPWSGHYEIGKSIWVMAHTGQFTQPGWQYLDSACGYLGGSKSNGSYVTLKSTNNTDYSIIIETLDATAAQTFSFTVTGGLSTHAVHVWATNLNSTNSQDYFVHQQTIALNQGTLSLTLEPGYLYSLSTTNGQHKGSAVGPNSAPLGLHYQENFDSYATGTLARYFSDINGAFETAAAGGGRTGNAYRQVITTAPIAWVKSFSPTTIVGDPNWAHYEVSVDILLEQAGWVELLGCANSSSIFTSSPSMAAYHFQISDTGAWTLYRVDAYSNQTQLASGQNLQAGVPTPLGFNIWHTLTLSFAYGVVQASLDSDVVATVYDAVYPGGQAGLSVSEWINAQFDNFVVNPKGSSHPNGNGNTAYTITNRNSGQALEIPAASITLPAAVADQNLYTYTQNQQWTFVALEGNYDKISNLQSGLVLEDLSSVTTTGSPIGQNPWSGGYNQQWSLVPASNGYTFIVNRLSGLVLEVPAQSTNPGAQVDQFTNNGGTNQQWSIGEVGFSANMFYTISNKNSGLALEIANSSTTVGATAAQNTYSYSKNQQWQLIPLVDHGYYKISNSNSGLVLEDLNGSEKNGATVDQVAWSGGYEQQWSFQPYNGYVTIKNRQSNHLLNVAGESVAPGAVVNLWSNDGYDSELWSIGKVGFGPSVPYKIVNAHSGLVLEIVGSSTTPGATTDQNTYTGNTGQQWNVVDLGNGYYKIVNVNSGQVIDDLNFASTPGSAVGQWSWNGGNDQQWKLLLNSNGTYTISEPQYRSGA